MSEPDPGGPPSSIAVSPTLEISDDPEGPEESEELEEPKNPEELEESEDAVEYTDGENSDDDASGSPDDGDSDEGDFVMEYVHENSRRYSNETYCFPSDEQEEIRLTVIHQVHLLLLKGELTISRMPRNVKRILDIGTGTGDWAIGMGDLFPRAEVFATDIATYKPINVPPNVTFQIEDSSLEWAWNEPFDFIHMRDLHGAFRDFLQVFRQAARFLKPSGTLEISNGGPFRLRQNYETSHSKIWMDACKVGMEMSGYAWWNTSTDKELIEQSGLRVMKQQHMEIRLGDFTDDAQQRRLGRMALVGVCESLESCSLRVLTKYMGWTVEQVSELNEKVKIELTDLNNEPCLDVEYIVARRVPGLDA